MSGAELATVYVGPDHCVSLYRNLIFFVAKSDPLPATPQLLPSWLKRLERACKPPLGLLVVLRPENPVPGEQVRATIKKIFSVVSGHIAFAAFVVEKEGFTAAAQRSVLNMIMLAARPPFAMKVFGTLEEASDWVAGKYGDPVKLTSSDLAGTVLRVTEAYNAGTLTELP
jgi:hypothetical protein